MAKETNWRAKESRELFCKFVNSVIMTDIKKLEELEKVHLKAEETVNRAFTLYPDEEAEEKAF